MKIANKLEYAKANIDSIASHDDAPAEEMTSAINELCQYAQQQAEIALVRRAQAKPNEVGP